MDQPAVWLQSDAGEMLLKKYWQPSKGFPPYRSGLNTSSHLFIQHVSVANPGCLSRILIFTHPGSRIQKQQQKREVKKISCHTCLYSQKFHKIVNYFSFKVRKKKMWASFQRIIELFTKKNVKKLLKYGLGIRKKPILDPGVKKAPDPGSATLQHVFLVGHSEKTALYCT